MLDRQALRLVSPEDFRMNTTNYLSTKKASINFRTVSGRLKHLRFFSKTNQIVFLLAFLVVLLSGCPGGPGGITPPQIQPLLDLTGPARSHMDFLFIYMILIILYLAI